MMENQPPTSPTHPSETEDTPRLLWQAPRLQRFGSVEEVTQGISYLPTDGLFNLTP